MPDRLTDADIATKLKDLSGWKQAGQSIEREFEFKDFAQALEFVNKVGAVAQQQDHHPDMLLHSWNKVKITASTHSAKGITENDIGLAREVNSLNT